MSRRARVNPGDVGLPPGPKRRVPGLRRSEVAQLAGVSVEYYSRLERGAILGASDSVLDGIARALRLDDAEREHLLRLAAAAEARPARRRASAGPENWSPQPSVQWTLDSMTSVVAMIGNGRTDLLATNALGRALYEEMIGGSAGCTPNFARYTFLDPGARRFYRDWEGTADVNVAMLRAEAGQNPDSKPLHDLVGELSTRSDEFRTRWASHDVRAYSTGTKRFSHRVVGDLTLAFEAFDLVSQPGAQMTTLSAQPGSPNDDALRLLASWAAQHAESTDALHDAAG